MLYRVLLFMLVGGLGWSGCTSDDGSDPSKAPRSNVPALQGAEGAGELSTEVDPTPVPDLTVQTLDGTSIALDEQPDRVLLINFWATWCPPCRKEIPDLIELQKAMGDDGLMVIGVSLDQEGASTVQPFVEEHNINYPIVVDDTKAVESALGPIYALPTTLVVGPDGMITRRITGIFPVDAMEEALKDMLSNAAS